MQNVLPEQVILRAITDYQPHFVDAVEPVEVAFFEIGPDGEYLGESQDLDYLATDKNLEEGGADAYNNTICYVILGKINCGLPFCWHL